ncbi:PASTA domain-containing protein [Gardnerella vaginalis]|nr:PASTA domain-containing protein [Gardnerella vaginalis]
MFCINCGNKIDADDKFCSSCGAVVENDVADSYSSLNSSNLSSSSQSHNSFKFDPLHNRKQLIIMITSIILAIALVITCTVLYCVKNPNSIANLTSAKTYAKIPKAKAGDNADNVAKTLENNGFRTKIIDEFGAEKQGNFLRYANVKPGSKVSTKTVVKILRSKGPGVPAKGVVGASLDNAKKIVKSMGVPVKLHHVPSTDAADGKIVASSPMPGNAVGKDGVINIAVGEKCDGVPVDVFGLDKDKAKDMLSSKPFSVDLRPKFSSAKYFGKIVGAYPALGTKGNPKAVTLYYGVDVSKTKDVVTEPMDYSDQTIYLVNHSGSFIGKWCTKSGDCINLLPRLMGGVSELDTEEKDIKELIPADIADKNGRIPDKDKRDNINLRGVLTLTSAGQDPADRAVFDKNVPNTKYMRNHLISGDTGAIELYAGGGIVQCGSDDILLASYGSACVNGKYVDFIGDSEKLDEITHDPGKDVGLYYTMQDFMVVVPVGAKFDKLINSGYFVGKPTDKPDLKRPFILRRNPKLYKETRKNLPAGGGNWVNPFIPSEKGRAVPFSPAPDDSNAYYLVEEPFDWSAIPGESL